MHKFAILVAGVCAASAASAATVQFSGDIGVGRSDNITRTAVDEQSDTIRAAGLQFSVLEETRRLNAELGADLSWLDYASDTFSDELVGSAAGQIRLALMREHLDWVIEDSFGQVRQDPFSASSPTNRENVNNFSTGPDLRLGLGAATNVLIGGRYTLVDYERSQVDTERYSGNLAVQRLLSSTASASLNLSRDKVSPQDAAISADYNRTGAYAQYAITGRRSNISFDLGANRVSGSGSSDTGLLVRLSLDRRLGAYSRLSFSAGQEYTDSGAELGLRPDEPVEPVPGTGTVSQTAAPYTNRFVRLGWDITGRRTAINLSGEWADQDHGSGALLNQQRNTLGLGLTRSLGGRTEAHANVQYDSYDYDAAGLDNHETVFALGLSWNFMRRIGLTVDGEHSNYGGAGQPTARETRYWLRLSYGERVSR